MQEKAETYVTSACLGALTAQRVKAPSGTIQCRNDRTRFSLGVAETAHPRKRDLAKSGITSGKIFRRSEQGVERVNSFLIYRWYNPGQPTELTEQDKGFKALTQTTMPQEVTQLLRDWRGGDAAAFDQLVPLVYAELRQIAQRYMSRERSSHTLQTTALVNEAYLRLVDQQAVLWQNRAHFFAVAAQVMRHLLVDHARARGFAKRGGQSQQVELSDDCAVTAAPSAELLALDEALHRLHTHDARKARIVELRYFGGLSVEETAEVLGLAGITVKREWLKAKAWLYRELNGSAEDIS